MIRTALCLLGLALSLPASAQLYKWVDANGRVQYSDRPPLDRPAQVLGKAAPKKDEEEAAPAAGEEGTAKPAEENRPLTWAEKEQEFRKRRIEAEEARRKQEQAEAQARAREEACQRSRNYLKGLESGRRVVRTNDKGELEYYDDAQIRREIERTREEIKTYCS